MITKLRLLKPVLAAVVLVTLLFLMWSAVNANESSDLKLGSEYQLTVESATSSPTGTMYVLRSKHLGSRVRTAVVYGSNNTLRVNQKVTLIVH